MLKKKFSTRVEAKGGGTLFIQIYTQHLQVEDCPTDQQAANASPVQGEEHKNRENRERRERMRKNQLFSHDQNINILIVQHK